MIVFLDTRTHICFLRKIRKRISRDHYKQYFEWQLSSTNIHTICVNIDGALSNVHCVTQIMFNYELKGRNFVKKFQNVCISYYKKPWLQNTVWQTNDILYYKFFIRRWTREWCTRRKKKRFNDMIRYVKRINSLVYLK